MKHHLALAAMTTAAGLAGLAAVATIPATTPVETKTIPALTPASDDQPMAECVEGETMSAIFAPGTDPEIIERVYNAIRFFDGSRFSPGGRWPGIDGQPVTIAYSFPSDGVTVNNALGGGSAPNTLNSLLTVQFGSEAAWKDKFEQIFDAWTEITGNVYVEVSDDDAPMGSSGPLHGGSGRGDIRITSINLDGSSGTLAYNYFPGSGDGGDMVLDTGDFWANPSNDFRFFRNTLSHEHGHGMGLNHVCPANGTKLMEPFLNTSFDGPQHDDIRGATFHYGDFYEPNNNAASAGFIKSQTGPGTEPFNIMNMSLLNDGDDDYYAFSVDGPGSIDVSVEIVGENYDNSGQQGGSCGSGNFFDSTSIVDPELAVLDTNGSTVLASTDANGFGGDETLTGVTLDEAGTYYIRVGSSVPDNGVAQIYDLTGAITIEEAAIQCVADLNGDGTVDTADLGILIGVFGGTDANVDLNDDGVVDTADLGILIGVFGGCTQE